ncbi:MAG: hypothetical protein KF757_10360 [Phycisphaeraceae bacterium]|nr:hypothetical protein [Phycisphaeraceae bacterium]MCW5764117.1 hypothetical protein [Phycisphaeraceae bacterium]
MIHLFDGSHGRVTTGLHPEATELAMRGMGATGPFLLGQCDRIMRWLLSSDGIIPSSLFNALSTCDASQPTIESGRVFAWGRSCAMWAMRGGIGADVPAEVGLLESPRPGSCPARVVRAISDFQRVVTFDEADAQAWIAAGVPGVRVEMRTPTVVLPTIGSRAELRARLGVGEHERLIFPIASPWNALDAQRFIFMIGLLRVIGIEASAIVPAQAWRLAEARVFRRRSGLGTGMFVIDGPLAAYLPACDAAFMDSARGRDLLFPYVPRGALRVLLYAAEQAQLPIAISPAAAIQPVPSRPLSVSEELSPLAELLKDSTTQSHAAILGATA